MDVVNIKCLQKPLFKGFFLCNLDASYVKESQYKDEPLTHENSSQLCFYESLTVELPLQIKGMKSPLISL